MKDDNGAPPIAVPMEIDDLAGLVGKPQVGETLTRLRPDLGEVGLGKPYRGVARQRHAASVDGGTIVARIIERS